MAGGGVLVNKFIFSPIVFLSVVVLALSFVLAAHSILTSSGETSYSVNEDTWFVYNITVNNTDANSVGNITNVNITLPSDFLLLANSNGTNAGTHTFENTSTVLSWTGSALVMNLTWKHFWFNATALTPGSYNLAVATTNATNTMFSNITIDINDTTSPVVELISPLNGTSSTLTTRNFTFNATDVSSLGCDLIVDDILIHSLASVSNLGVTAGMYNSSFSVGTHNWSINCTDSAGNIGNSTVWNFTVSAEVAAATIPATSSSGGDPVFKPSDDDLSFGYERIMLEDWKISFTIAGNSHVLDVKEIDPNSVKVIVSSTPQEAIISLGQEKKFELSGDDYYDLSVKLNSIHYSNLSASKASFTIRTINESTSLPATSGQATTGSDTSDGSLVGESSTGSGMTWVIVIAVIILLAVVGYFIYLKFK